MLNQIREYIRQQHMFHKGDRVVVGVSSGADSMCLLSVLMKIQKEYSLTLFVVHVNHQIRGTEANLEEQYVHDFCVRNNIHVHCVQRNVQAIAKRIGCSVEEAGRKVRYEIFQEECDQENCHKIAIAHNMNDNAETVLFHLFRGSKIEGMSGIHSVNQKIVRPLLQTKRETIEAFLKQEGISYCTDSSNLSLDYTRNKIRNRILPYVREEINERAIEHIVSFAREMEHVSAFLNRLTDTVYPQIVNQKDNRAELNLELLKQQDPILQRSIMKRAIETVCRAKKDIEEIHVQSALELANKQTGKKISLPYHIIVQRGYTTLIVKKYENSVDSYVSAYPLNVVGITEIPNTETRFECKVMGKEGMFTIPKNCYTKCYDYDKIKDTVVIRTRQQGDFLQINKNGGTKMLKALFIDEKIPKEERDRMLLLASGSHILWIPGVRSSEAFQVDEDTTKILTVTLMK